MIPLPALAVILLITVAGAAIIISVERLLERTRPKSECEPAKLYEDDPAADDDLKSERDRDADWLFPYASDFFGLFWQAD